VHRLRRGLGPARAGKVAEFGGLDGSDSQQLRASGAFLSRAAKKCFSPRLARERRARRMGLAAAHHDAQEAESKPAFGN
jgi:hypothetical protein